MTRAIGIVGCGAIGRALLRAGDTDRLGAPIAGVTSRTDGPAREFLATLDSPPPYLELEELVECSSLVDSRRSRCPSVGRGCLWRW